MSIDKQGVVGANPFGHFETPVSDLNKRVSAIEVPTSGELRDDMRNEIIALRAENSELKEENTLQQDAIVNGNLASEAMRNERDALRAAINEHNRQQLKACGQAYCGEPDGNMCNDCPRRYHLAIDAAIQTEAGDG